EPAAGTLPRPNRAVNGPPPGDGHASGDQDPTSTRQVGELFEGEGLAAAVGVDAGGGEGGGGLLARPAQVAGAGEAVEEVLAPLPEGGVDDGEEARCVHLRHA